MTGRTLGIDLGTRRIGVAVSDARGVLASPVTVLERHGGATGREADHRAIAALAGEYGAERVVVGLPLSLDGSMGPAARAASEEADELRAALPPGIGVETYDERFTTVTASHHLDAANVRGKARRKVIDQAAAAVLLQAWLDGQRPVGQSGQPL